MRDNNVNANCNNFCNSPGNGELLGGSQCHRLCNRVMNYFKQFSSVPYSVLASGINHCHCLNYWLNVRERDIKERGYDTLKIYDNMNIMLNGDSNSKKCQNMMHRINDDVFNRIDKLYKLHEIYEKYSYNVVNHINHCCADAKAFTSLYNNIIGACHDTSDPFCDELEKLKIKIEGENGWIRKGLCPSEVLLSAKEAHKSVISKEPETPACPAVQQQESPFTPFLSWLYSKNFKKNKIWNNIDEEETDQLLENASEIDKGDLNNKSYHIKYY
ncbi:PIR protein [Plasmodium ovale]|uniref:PIR protein n=1 Tax=Plasmodium ovale TaxID=36330 RepID=A0A1D3JDL3_PLAOA|nr:PIR protein [Plasmodium ovale]